MGLRLTARILDLIQAACHQGESFSEAASSDSTMVSIGGSESVDTSEPSVESGEEAVSEAAESESSSSVSADRRSYY